MTSSFVHLHNHSEYSMLDGAARIKPMVEEAARLGQPALGITDHGYLFGAYEFYKAAKSAGIKPIIGLEAYVTPGTSRKDTRKVQWGEPGQRQDDVSAGGAYNHLTLLAYSTEGVHNLFRLGSWASLEGQMGKWPRADKELLQRYHQGLIVFTGCPSGAVQTRMRLGQWDEAVREAGELREIFGPENFYVEIMDHGIEFEKRTRPGLLKLAKLMNAPLVATNDSHYVRKEDARVQEAELAINSGSLLTDEPSYKGGSRFAFEGSGYYLRSSEEMRVLFDEFPNACDTTLEIAERCEVEFQTTSSGANYMPVFQLPAGEDETSWFIKEVQRGLHWRFGQNVPAHVLERAKYEEGIIVQMGFPGYFLVVADFIRWARDHGIRVGPGRGSGAGSMVAYALGITQLNPFEHGLLFERFLNPERVSMPDFDVDFDERRREEVIQYVREKYGDDKVSQVVTFGRIKTKQALKDSARILGHDFKTGEDLTKALPPAVMGKDIPIKGVFDETHARYAEASEFRKFYDENEYVHEVVDLAKELEGLARQWSVHACAVIMSSHTLTDVIPLMKRPSDGAVITQFEYPICEELGLLKMDFLGLRNLTVISDTLENIRLNGKEVPILEELALDDRETYELMQNAETLGVFQFDKSGMRELLRLMKPDNFEDISAASALYRPGPMGAGSHTNYALRKNGKQKITPIHPELAEPLAEILDPTYGLIVYQEQVMQIAQKVAGYSLGQADMLRRAMGKKKKEILDKEFEPFKAGMLERGFSTECVQQLWDVLVPFADYAFNKSHSAAYGLVSYWTAYLKKHYPVEFMASLLTSTTESKDRRTLYLAECRHMGITVLPPDVNSSMGTFAPDKNGIRFGLSAVQNVGSNVVEAIISAREEQGKFTSFQDFLKKVPATVCNKRTIASLIKAGAFDSFGQSRRALTLKSDEAVDSVTELKRNEATGQFDLFSALGGETQELSDTLTVEIPDLPEWERKQKLAFEREMLGLYVSDHPLYGIERVLAKYQDVEIVRITSEDSHLDNKNVKIAGLITGVQHKTNKNGAPWAIATIEDLSGSVEVMFFAKSYSRSQADLSEDNLVQIEGRVSVREGGTQIIGNRVQTLDIRSDGATPLNLVLQAGQCSVETLNKVSEVLRAYPGSNPVILQVKQGDKQTSIEADSKFWVDRSRDLIIELKVILGATSVV